MLSCVPHALIRAAALQDTAPLVIWPLKMTDCHGSR